MAYTIESQVRKELSQLEEIVTAVEKLGNIGASLDPQDMADYAYVSYFLGSKLQEQFQAFHSTVVQKCLPHVVLMTSVKA